MDTDGCCSYSSNSFAAAAPGGERQGHRGDSRRAQTAARREFQLIPDRASGRQPLGKPEGFAVCQPPAPWRRCQRRGIGSASQPEADRGIRRDFAFDGNLKMLTYRQHIPQAKRTQDFIGVNYYSRDYVAFQPLQPSKMFMRLFYRPEDELSGTGYIANTPENFYEIMKSVLKYKLPLIISENGMEDQDDKMRPRYTLQHIHQVWRGVNFNWMIKGYFHWSLVDNFEWERGWTQRFGLWGLNEKTQKRIRRKSVDLYADICKENGITTEIVEKYTPELMSKIFPA